MLCGVMVNKRIMEIVRISNTEYYKIINRLYKGESIIEWESDYTGDTESSGSGPGHEYYYQKIAKIGENYYALGFGSHRCRFDRPNNIYINRCKKLGLKRLIISENTKIYKD
jgi:hypothetical protein